MFHMSEGMGQYWVLDSAKYNKLPAYVSPSESGSRVRSGERLGPDHNIVQIPSSPSRSSSWVNKILRPRLAWLIVLIVVVSLLAICKLYEEKMRQTRMAEYTVRVNELKDSVHHLEHQISAAQIKLREWKENYKRIHAP